SDAVRHETALRATEDGLRQAIHDNGGGRLEEIAREQTRLRSDLAVRQQKRELFHSRAKSVGLGIAITAETFPQVGEWLRAREEQLTESDVLFERRRTDLEVEFRKRAEEISAV